MGKILEWPSNAAKPYVDAMCQSLLDGWYGVDIFSPGFKAKDDVEWKYFHEPGDEDWLEKFTLKQDRENLTSWIKSPRG